MFTSTRYWAGAIDMKPSKFKSIACTVDGIKFPSLKEAGRWRELMLLQRAGEIRNLRRQVAIKLMCGDVPVKTRTGRAMKLTVDFAYEDRRLNWVEVYEESKGMRTRDYDVRVAVVHAMGITVVET